MEVNIKKTTLSPRRRKHIEKQNWTINLKNIIRDNVRIKKRASTDNDLVIWIWIISVIILLITGALSYIYQKSSIEVVKITNWSYIQDDYSEIIENLKENHKKFKKTPSQNVSKEKKDIDIPKEIKVAEKSWNDTNFDSELIKFTTEWEWAFQPKAFCDSYYSDAEKIKYWITYPWLIRKSAIHCTKWTIWFWTNSFPWEEITLKEAKERRDNAILARKNTITSDCISDKAKIVAIDFIYQYSSKYANQMRYYANTCQENRIIWYIIEHRDYYRTKNQWGLVKREQKRLNYFYN